MVGVTVASPRFCPRCLAKRNGYSCSEEPLCYPCQGVYGAVFAELAAEARELRDKADAYQVYVGDCRPWRQAAELTLPLYALNRLALAARAFPDPERGFPTYHEVVGVEGAAGGCATVYAGNAELLSRTWPLTSASLGRGLEHLRRSGLATPVASSPFDAGVELWVVKAPYKRPDLNGALRAAGIDPRRPAPGRKKTKKRRRGGTPVAA